MPNSSVQVQRAYKQTGAVMRFHLSDRSVVCALCSVLLFLACQVASATDRAHVSTIQQVYPQADGSFVLAFYTDNANCTNASSPKYYYVTAGQNGVNADGVKLMFASALAAAAQQRTVTIVFSDTTVNCYINRLIVAY